MEGSPLGLGLVPPTAGSQVIPNSSEGRQKDLNGFSHPQASASLEKQRSVSFLFPSFLPFVVDVQHPGTICPGVESSSQRAAFMTPSPPLSPWHGWTPGKRFFHKHSGVPSD